MQAGFSVSKSFKNDSCNENQEQPSPISVLEPSFDEDDHSIPEFYNNLKPDSNGNELLTVLTLQMKTLILYLQLHFCLLCLFPSNRSRAFFTSY